jgi:hypothetical protein
MSPFRQRGSGAHGRNGRDPAVDHEVRPDVLHHTAPATETSDADRHATLWTFRRFANNRVSMMEAQAGSLRLKAHRQLPAQAHSQITIPAFGKYGMRSGGASKRPREHPHVTSNLPDDDFLLQANNRHKANYTERGAV